MEKEYFYDSIFSVFSNAVFNVHGAVGCEMLKTLDDSQVHFTVYNVPMKVIESLGEVEEAIQSHIIFKKTYDLYDVCFGDKMSVLKMINSISRDLEICLYA